MPSKVYLNRSPSYHKITEPNMIPHVSAAVYHVNSKILPCLYVNMPQLRPHNRYSGGLTSYISQGDIIQHISLHDLIFHIRQHDLIQYIKQ